MKWEEKKCFIFNTYTPQPALLRTISIHVYLYLYLRIYIYLYMFIQVHFFKEKLKADQKRKGNYQTLKTEQKKSERSECQKHFKCQT